MKGRINMRKFWCIHLVVNAGYKGRKGSYFIAVISKLFDKIGYVEKQKITVKL